MARVTVEDCSKNIKNRFDLVVIASQRARQILAGAKPVIDADNDKIPVIALREIADHLVNTEDIYNQAVSKYRRYVPCDEQIEDLDEDTIEDSYSPIIATDNESDSDSVLDDDKNKETSDSNDSVAEK